MKPFVLAEPGCPSLSAAPVTEVVYTPALRPAAAAATPWSAALVRPKSRVEAIGAGYAAPAAAARRGVDSELPSGMAGVERPIGTNGKQQDQNHLMSRRDPRSWRPPA
ncbi:MAG: hypothetical protein ACRDSS_00550 [Actinocrinis sp.]